MRETLKAASECVTCEGRTRRTAWVEAWESGTSAVARISGCTLMVAALYSGKERPSTGTVVHETTALPSTEAAALSGWPSNAEDNRTS